MKYVVYKQMPPSSNGVPEFEPVGALEAKSGADAIAKAYEMPEFRAMKRLKMSDFPVVKSADTRYT